MAQYLLNNITPAGRTVDPAELQQVIARVMDVTQQMQDAGVWVFSMPVGDPGAATLVRANGDGPTVGPSPLADLPEFVGGFTVIDAADAEAAQQWAGKVSAATGLPVEVRPGPGVAG